MFWDIVARADSKSAQKDEFIAKTLHRESKAHSDDA
jgi:hypothetical protein